MKALDGLSFAVPEGSFLSLLGPSGCGKSTALRMIAGLSRPSEGRIVWHGDDPIQSRDIGFVFQDATLMPWATVYDNVRLPLRLKGSEGTGTSDRIMEALALVGLESFARAYPRELSGGMRMRASIARAIVARPRVLLLDEPFAALDEITRFRLNDDLLRLWQSFGWTVVFVTHSVFESVYLSQRLVVMTPRPGRVAATFEVPAAPRDAAFRTSAPYNAICRDVTIALDRAMESAR
ncbi:MAG: ABC transporter ATP-binding protein [Bauldia sp.]